MRGGGGGTKVILHVHVDLKIIIPKFSHIWCSLWKK